MACNYYSPLRGFVKASYAHRTWYILEDVNMPHSWILGQVTLEKIGYTDILVALDKLNKDTHYNSRNIKLGYEGDDGPWM